MNPSAAVISKKKVLASFYAPAHLQQKLWDTNRLEKYVRQFGSPPGGAKTGGGNY